MGHPHRRGAKHINRQIIVPKLSGKFIHKGVIFGAVPYPSIFYLCIHVLTKS